MNRSRFPYILLVALLSLSLGTPARAQFDTAGANGAAPGSSFRSSRPLGDVSAQEPRYGVIINGDTEERHRENADLVFSFMKSYYHIPASNIYFLSTRQGEGGIEAPATGHNVVAVAQQLAQKLTANDELVVYTTGHGGNEQPVGAFLALEDAIVPAKQFAQLFLKNKAGKTIYFGDQCDSGALARAMVSTDKKVLSISSVDESHSTVCNFFIVPYLNAFNDPANDNDPKDGIVSEWEAFKAAKAASLEGHRQMFEEIKRNNPMAQQDETPEEMASGLYLLSPAYQKGGPGVM